MVSPYQTWAIGAQHHLGMDYGTGDRQFKEKLATSLEYGKLAREWVRQELERMWPGDLDPRPDPIQPGIWRHPAWQHSPPPPLSSLSSPPQPMMTGSDMAQSELNTCTQHYYSQLTDLLSHRFNIWILYRTFYNNRNRKYTILLLSDFALMFCKGLWGPFS